MRNEYKGRQILDVRLWYIPKCGGEMVPSQKGFSFDFSKAKLLAKVLNEIQ